MKFLKKKSGFTLIELLVVVAIIGILATVVLTALGSVREKAKEARKLSDLSQLRNAFELYNLDNGEYPNVFSGETAYCIGKSATDNCWGGNKTGNTTLNTMLEDYLPLDYFANLDGTDGSSFLYHNGRISRTGCNSNYEQGLHILWQPFTGQPQSTVDGDALPQSANDCPGESFFSGCGFGIYGSSGYFSSRHCALLLE